VRIILVGAPGAGKGTQAQTLTERLGVVQVASGDLFRAARNSGTEIGKKAAGYMDRGELVPDDIVIAMVMERLGKPDAAKGYILDGFPRTVAQAEALDAALKGKGQKIDRVLYLNVSEKELVNRLGGRWICRNCQTPYHEVTNKPKKAGVCDKCGGPLYQREDDKAETVRNRLQVYFRETAPLIEYYRKQGNLKEINGEGDVSAIRGMMLGAVGAA
jgi:adenylate kinase